MAPYKAYQGPSGSLVNLVGRLAGTTAVTRPHSVGIVPSSVTNLEVWLDADDAATITSASNLVSAWTSKDPNSRVFTQATGALQPTVTAAALNGKPVLTFSAHRLVSNIAASNWIWLQDSNKHTTFIVARYGNTASPAALYLPVGTNGGRSTFIGTAFGQDDRSAVKSLYHYSANGAGRVYADFTNAVATFNQHVLTVYQGDPGNATAADRSRTWVNGTTLYQGSVETGVLSTSAPRSPLTIGSGWDGAEFQHVGAIAEVVIYRGLISTNDREGVTAYLKDKWGVA